MPHLSAAPRMTVWIGRVLASTLQLYSTILASRSRATGNCAVLAHHPPCRVAESSSSASTPCGSSAGFRARSSRQSPTPTRSSAGASGASELVVRRGGRGAHQAARPGTPRRAHGSDLPGTARPARLVVAPRGGARPSRGVSPAPHRGSPSGSRVPRLLSSADIPSAPPERLRAEAGACCLRTGRPGQDDRDNPRREGAR